MKSKIIIIFMNGIVGNRTRGFVFVRNHWIRPQVRSPPHAKGFQRSFACPFTQDQITFPEAQRERTSVCRKKSNRTFFDEKNVRVRGGEVGVGGWGGK